MSDSLTALSPSTFCHILRTRNKAREIKTIGGLGIDAVQRLSAFPGIVAVPFLKEQFRQWTEESTEPHFQSFDKEWEEWLEVDEDFKAGNIEQTHVMLLITFTELEMNLCSIYLSGYSEATEDLRSRGAGCRRQRHGGV